MEKELKDIEGIKNAFLNISSGSLYIDYDGGVIGDDRVYDESVKALYNHEKKARLLKTDNRNKAETQEKETDRNRIELIKIAVSLILFAASFLFKGNVRYAMLFLAYIVSGYEIIWEAFKNMLSGKFMDENFLMTIATFGAVYLGEYAEAAGVMMFYMIGEYFQDLAVDTSKRNIKKLMNLRPDFVNIERNGSLIKVEPEDVQKGEIITVRQGEKIPLDGIIVDGETQLDTKALTGESMPREANKGDEVLSGSFNLTSSIKIKTTKAYSESTVARIMELVEKSSANKGKTEKFITRFASVYTPAVVLTAVFIGLILPLLLHQPMAHWFRKGLVFLVISCPCALVISIPLGYFGGIGLASSNGILVKGSNYLEELRNIKAAVLDKTGTVTQGVFKVTEINPADGFDEKTLLYLASSAEADSPHPIGVSVRERAGEFDRSSLKSTEEIRGKGSRAVLNDGKTVMAGNSKFLKENGITVPETQGTTVFVALKEKDDTNYTYAGFLLIEDVIKDDSKEAIRQMKEMGVKEITILSGDSEKIVEKVSKEAGADRWLAELLPEDKVNEFSKIKEKAEGITIFAGDGLNDTPVLKMADIGISMGQIGSDAAMEASDVVIMDDSLSKIPLAMKISSMTKNIVMQNIYLALGVKLLIMIYSLGFKENMWLAIFADVGVAILAVLNSARLTRMKP